MNWFLMILDVGVVPASGRRSRTTSKAVESADSFTAGDTVDAGADRGRHHQGCDADRHRHPRGGAPNIPYSQRDRQCPDATDVLCVTHRRSSIDVVAERWPPRRVEFREGNRRSRCGGTSAVVHHCNLTRFGAAVLKLSRELTACPSTDTICNHQMEWALGRSRPSGGRSEPGGGVAMRRVRRGWWFRSSSWPGRCGFRRCGRKESVARQLRGWTIPHRSASRSLLRDRSAASVSLA